ncbi:NADH-quinone oxidoreductase subunit N [Qaidamihabitans albus]|uniref:NADH-quinone oxidoreductase subunit N n=1 Tax=Qaidamihabitans albus TaxID=2795733 RepID=UPI0018F245A2|nr:NADH-quinone oxidoreductase subunit N [Qaidamihabitans albus]
MITSLLLVLPELLLTGGAVFGLLLGSFLPRRRQWAVRALAALVCAAALAATVAGWHRTSTAFEGAYSVDVPLGATRVVVLVSVLLVLCLAGTDIHGHRRESEFVVLVLLGALGAVLLSGANDLLLLVAAYLLASVPLYALTAFGKDAPGTEAALKYYLLGALLGVTMLFGALLLFGTGGATAYPALREGLPGAPGAAVAVGVIALFAGLLFKAGAVPAHFWVPDVTEGARPPVAALVTTIPKIGAVVALYRIGTAVLAPTTLAWPLLVAIIAAATMTLGNLAAFFQDNVRRLLAYSTIGQVGYVLMAVAAATGSGLALPSLLLYLGAYAVTNLGAFAVVCAFPAARTLGDYTGLRRRHPWLALSLVIVLLGLVGTPPTAVFAGKLTVFTAALDAGFGWLVVLAVANTVASVFYYLRWIVPALRSGPWAGERPGRWAAAGALTAAPATILIGVLAGPVLTVLDGGPLPG